MNGYLVANICISNIGVDDGVNPEDSVSNVAGKPSTIKRSTSGKISTTSSARIKEKPEKAL